MNVQEAFADPDDTALGRVSWRIRDYGAAAGKPDVKNWHEIVTARTRNAKKFRNPQKHTEFAIVVGVGSLHYQGPSGEWKNPRFVPEDVGNAFRFKEVGAPITVPKKADEKIQIAFDAGTFAFSFVNAIPVDGAVQPVGRPLETSRVAFAGPFPDVDVAFEAEIEGLREFITLLGPAHPQTFNFDVETDLVMEEQDGNVVLLDGEGNEVGFLQKPFVKVSETETRWGRLQVKGHNHLLMHLPDLQGLEYPITIDPTAWERVDSGPDDGYAVRNWGSWNSGDVRLNFGRGMSGEAYEPAIRFDYVPTVLRGKHVVHAWVEFVADNTQGNQKTRLKIRTARDNDNDIINDFNEWDQTPRSYAWTNWVIPPWTAGTYYDTPNIALPIQEALDTPGYNDHFLAFFDECDQIACSDNWTTRSAYSYEGASPYAPKLYVVYESTPQRLVSNDYWADFVLGQPDWEDITMNDVHNEYTWDPGGMVYDATRDYLYIQDTNQRILVTRPDWTQDDDTWDVMSLDIVNTIGTPGKCNGDSSFQSQEYPAPSPTTLCTQWPFQPSISEAPLLTNIAVRPSDGALIVPDIYNNRVLLFLEPWVDSIADDVIGQVDMYSGLNLVDAGCNKGDKNSPASDTLCFAYTSRWEDSNPPGENRMSGVSWVAGVTVDASENLWVADPVNHRVLRFPKGGSYYSSTADIVMGQSGFGNRQDFGCAGTSLTYDGRGLCYPSDVYFDTSLNKMFVAVHGGYPNDPSDDVESPGRVNIFTYFYSGNTHAEAVWDGGSRYWGNTPVPISVDYDPGIAFPISLEPYSSPTGIWVTDAGNHQMLLYDDSTHNETRILLKDIARFDGQSCPSAQPWDTNRKVRWKYDLSEDYLTCLHDPSGVAVLNDNSVLVAGKSTAQNVYRFPSGIPSPTSGYIWNGDARLFNRYQCCFRNRPAKQALGSLQWDGIDYLPQSQGGPTLFVVDGNFIKEFQSPMYGPNYDAPDRVFWQSPLQKYNIPTGDDPLLPQGGPPHLTQNIVEVDTSGNPVLWAYMNNTLTAYTLPLSDPPNQIGSSLSGTVPIMGRSETVSLSNITSLEARATRYGGGYIWFSRGTDHAVYRVRSPLGSSPVIDAIVGVPPWENPGWPDNDCTKADPTRDGLCHPQSVTVDRYGNLWVTDRTTEGPGWERVTEYDARRIPTGNSSLIIHVDADRAYLTGGSFVNTCASGFDCGPRAVGFDANGYMYLGRITWAEAGLLPVSIWTMPLDQDAWRQQADEFLYDLHSYAGDVEADERGDVFVSGVNRNRVLLYSSPYSHQGRHDLPQYCGNLERVEISVYNTTGSAAYATCLLTRQNKSTQEWDQSSWQIYVPAYSTQYCTTDVGSSEDAMDITISSQDVFPFELTTSVYNNYCH